MSPPVQLFLTTIASQPTLRQRQEYILRILQVKKIPYTSYDLASDEAAKRLWKRKAPPGKQELPGILIGNTWPGPFSAFEEAVEYGELDTFLRRNEEWDAELEGHTAPVPQVTGVPGVMTPEKITGQRPSFAPEGSAPTPAVREGELDMGVELSGYGLQGLKVTTDEITELVKSLGLDDGDASDLITGLDFSAPTKPKSTPEAPIKIQTIQISPEVQPDEVEEESEGSDSDEGPRIDNLKGTRKRTDERPLPSP
ncbi:hypothetical protein BS47DRAFT_1300200 [Hydnum rufescens UP504]|uniref:SH3 domain-binding glutamic acid-rich protein n=1 Tax=Hydnum rufescens UP504 TaxID=1448309 RepID=A0A9P6AT75_9AGAM|nr:hypothetical protein BS47DRAFT_1300200 [Hydnum rufescens UP504]